MADESSYPNDLAECHALLAAQQRELAMLDRVIAQQVSQLEEQKAEIAKVSAERDQALQLLFRKKMERYLAEPQQIIKDAGDDPDVVAEVMVAALAARGSTHAWVVHGGGLDELSTTGPSTVAELRSGAVSSMVVDPSELGLSLVDASSLVGGSPAVNADVVRRVLAGEPGQHRDIVVLNAAAALVVADRAADLAEGLALAAESIDSGRAAAVLDRLVIVSGRVGSGDA